jgi:hypothetical protein
LSQDGKGRIGEKLLDFQIYFERRVTGYANIPDEHAREIK